MTRRDFLRASALMAGGLSTRLALARPHTPSRVLILVELQGGNDALNMLIPYSDPRYATLRGALALPRDQVVPLDERFALHPAMTALQPVWQTNGMAFVTGVACPSGDRSHFKSIDIWEGADPTLTQSQGWLVSPLTAIQQRHHYPLDGIVIGQDLGPLSGGRLKATAMSDLDLLASSRGVVAGDSAMRDQPMQDNPALAHLRQVDDQLHQGRSVLRQRLQDAITAEDPPFTPTALGDHFRTALKLVKMESSCVIKLTHTGYDTHTGQLPKHTRLLGDLSANLAILADHLQRIGKWQNTLLMTYSEFGRRVAANGSEGSDHGLGGTQLLMGGAVQGGFYGRSNLLGDLMDGDIPLSIDFRRLYNSVIRDYWGQPAQQINPRQYPAMARLLRRP